MRLSIRVKMLLIALLTSLAGVVLVGIVGWAVTIFAFDDFLREGKQEEFENYVEDYYIENGSLEGIARSYGIENDVPLPVQPPSGAGQRPNQPPNQQGNNSQRPQPNDPRQLRNNTPPQQDIFVLADANGVILISGGKYKVGERVSNNELNRGEEVDIDNVRIGTILSTGQAPERDERDNEYIEAIGGALVIGGIGGAIVAVLVGILAAQVILRPVRDLETGIHALREGKLDHQIPVRNKDELGEVATAFNEMSTELARANLLRRQMTADIAHDLRTPLGVLTGYLEAIKDGVLEASQERFEIMYDEAKQIERLTDDLRTLSLADAGELPLHLQVSDVGDLLQNTAQSFERKASEQGVALSVTTAKNLPSLTLDPDRITQVLGNLVSNALRYTTEGGRITLSAQQHDSLIEVRVADTGSGIPTDKLPHIFERFYRADSARDLNEGSSGLGLAIAKSIIEAHGGTIHAESVVGQGTTMVIQLPIVGE